MINSAKYRVKDYSLECACSGTRGDQANKKQRTQRGSFVPRSCRPKQYSCQPKNFSQMPKRAKRPLVYREEYRSERQHILSAISFMIFCLTRDALYGILMGKKREKGKQQKLYEEIMNKKFIHHLSIIFITFTSVFFFYTPVHADILFTANYETGNFSQGLSKSWNAFCCSYSAQIVTSPVRAGTYAARYELRDTDTFLHGKRSERIYWSDSRIGNIGGPDEWYGFSIYLPHDYEVDDHPRRHRGLGMREILAQWHDTPDPGEAGKTPPLSLMTDLGKWKFITMYSSKPFQTSNDGTWVALWEAPYQRGVWTDWVVHVKWSYQSDGFLEIWKDGIKIVDYKGPNCYNNKGNNYFQWGIYKAWWNAGPTHVTKRIVYNDELRIGDSNSSYAEVAPPVPDNIRPAKPTLTIATTVPKESR